MDLNNLPCYIHSMRILVDMDDVLEKLVEAWVSALNSIFGTDTKAEDVDDWDIAKAFPTLTPEQVYSVETSDDMWRSVKPIPGAAEGLKTLIAQGHEIFIVTATKYQSVKCKMEDVLFKYYPFLTWDQVIITSRKQLINGDVLIDDAPHNLIGGSYKKILFSAGHNRYFDEQTIGAVRVSNWEEVVKVIAGFSQEN